MRRRLVWLALLFSQIALAQLHPDVKFPPDTIRAPDLKGYSIVINIPQRTLYLFAQGKLERTYPVAVGKRGTPSPLGKLKIINKVVNPTWYPEGKAPVPPGPANPLGRRWLGLSIPGYGIHGNNRPASIGTAVSLGCIRMHNQDVEELFKLVPVGTTVELVYEILILRRKDGELHVSYAEDIYALKPERNLDRALAGLPVSKLALPLIRNGGPVPWKLEVQFNASKAEGFYWKGEAYVPVMPLLGALGWRRSGVEVILPDGKTLAADVAAGGELFVRWERLQAELRAVPGLSWQEEGLELKIRWQEGETPPVFLRNFGFQGVSLLTLRLIVAMIFLIN